MAKLEIFLSEPVHAREQETAVVQVSAAPQNAQLTVRLEQVQGKRPFWLGQPQTVTTDGAGTAFVSFSVAVEGPTPSATLVASADDPVHTPYTPDAHSFEVFL